MTADGDTLIERWSAAAPTAMLRERCAAIAGKPEHQSLIRGVLVNSPYLKRLLFAEHEYVSELLTGDIDDLVTLTIDQISASEPAGRRALLSDLGAGKRRVALGVALGDLANRLSLEQVTRHLSRFADIAVAKTLRLMLGFAVDRNELPSWVLEEGAPHGLFVLGMGKLGAFELNYSSDIDLIIFFDEERFPYRGPESAMASTARIARGIAGVLDAETGRDYILRVDYRLRPRPAAQPLALSTEAAEAYYERQGQNRDRAALVKARAIAGDVGGGEAFLTRLRPFLWRRHLDFASINDIRAVKHQIDRHRGHGQVRTAGHNIKIGRGGIREIEFFAQTQQLILGGRHPELRVRETREALHRLVDGGWLDAEVASELSDAYVFLRRTEHRLQMIDDKQTHSLPERREAFDRFARFMGFEEPGLFEDQLSTHLLRVEKHFSELFDGTSIDGRGGRLVFTGTDPDPETVDHLTRLGFGRAKDLIRRIAEWHHGHIRATRSERARELLTELHPALIEALAAHHDPDAAFQRFDEFVSSLPAGVQVFSLLRAHEPLLRVIVTMMGAAPRMARRLVRQPQLFDAMLTNDFLDDPPDKQGLAEELDASLAVALSLEEMFDRARLWASGRQFQLELQVLLGRSRGVRLSPRLVDIAELVIERMLPPVERWLADQHGTVPGGRFAVIAMGKLGSRELSIGSDLDLIFIYDAPDGAMSDGTRPLAAATFYARLGQRLVSAISARTAEGRLYEIDMRLRPSGKAGPVASSLAAFDGYQRRTAALWEHQALTRARPIAGDPALCDAVRTIITDVLATPRDPVKAGAEIVAMRERVFGEHGSDDPWQLKHVRGGIVSLEFLAQFLVLTRAQHHPDLAGLSTTEVFRKAQELDCLSEDQADILVRAYEVQTDLDAVLRLAADQGVRPKEIALDLERCLTRAGALAFDDAEVGLDMVRLEAALTELQARVERLAASIYGVAADPVDGSR
ncbi:MAG: bifunctional [glutamine synthetase] adenylyltransferase/[glutamine synthetase]-adenylyl-L-tyrosine phosphorylase [Geminicoccaceae bacterium]